jgi:HrpA-like RNA helicase
LAQRIADETGTEPGELAGWTVRGESVRNAGTRILFVTPGVALRMMGTGELERFETWILDEFHERRADVDALLAWARWKGETSRLVLLSATLDSASLGQELSADVLSAEGRIHPVDIEHRAELGQTWPGADGLPLRLERALRGLDQTTGTVLVFLPGVGEILDCAAWLEGRVPGQILELHGGLSLERQRGVLDPADGLRIVLSTNVAESALTVPGVLAVVDSGLERRIVRSGGFPSLELQPISQASADQRAGRAGRTAPGRCIRLWSAAARLEARPRPGIQVDDPDDWLLPLLAAGADPWSMPWLDKPRADGLRDALDRFRRAGIWLPDPWTANGGALSERGFRCLQIPLPPDLAGICLSQEGGAAFRDLLALSCAVSQARPILQGKPSRERFAARRELASGSDDLALLSRTVRSDADQARSLGVRMQPWRETRELWDRLRDQLGVDDDQWPSEFQSDSVVKALCTLEPRALRVRRGPVGKEEYALGDGAGLRPSNSSLVFSDGAPELALAVSTHGGVDAQWRRRVWIEAAEGISKARAMRLDLGRAEVEHAENRGGSVWARWTLKTGNVVLGKREGEALDPRIWSQAVVQALDASTLDAIRGRLDDLWLERCLEAQTWIAPPETAQTWLARELEGMHLRGEIQPPAWPSSLPMPPEVSDSTTLRKAFPNEVDGAGGTWLLRWEVGAGKLRVTPPAGVKFHPPSIPTAKGWSVKKG